MTKVLETLNFVVEQAGSTMTLVYKPNAHSIFFEADIIRHPRAERMFGKGSDFRNFLAYLDYAKDKLVDNTDTFFANQEQVLNAAYSFFSED